jgi:TonB family protein
MTPLALSISRALIHFAWQGFVVSLLLSIVLFLLRKKSANARYLAACCALAVLAVLPVATTLTFYGALQPAASSVKTLPSAAGNAGETTLMDAGAKWLSPLQTWTLPIWSIGVLIFSLRLVLGYRHAFRLRRYGKVASDGVQAVVRRLQEVIGVQRPIRVLMSSMADSPSVVGWLRPVILLPAATLLGLTPLQLEAILAHEIGHIKRYDYLVNMLQMLVETLLFYHPAVWWTSKRIRLERELCCDDLAVRLSGDALQYARALTKLEKLRTQTPSVAMASIGGPLFYRIQRLAGIAPKDHGTSRFATALAIGLAAVCFALNATWIQGQDAPGVKVDLGASSVIHRTPVQYPEAVRRQKIEGIVQVEAKLDSTGNVADARVLSGPEELRKAALESVLNWHFTSDAARSSRLISISFSQQGTQVEVQEPKLWAAARAGIVEANTPVAFLEDQFKEMAVKLRELESHYTPQHPDVIQAQRSIEEIKLKLAKLRLTQAVNASQEPNPTLTRGQQLEREVAALRRQLQENYRNLEDVKVLEAKLASAEAEMNVVRLAGARGRESLNSTLFGRPLKGISTPGLSDAVRNDLLSRLPLRAGDIVSEELWKQTDAAIHNYDEHMAVRTLLTDDGQVEIRIISSGQERR